jgi:hypothetical protein
LRFWVSGFGLVIRYHLVFFFVFLWVLFYFLFQGWENLARCFETIYNSLSFLIQSILAKNEKKYLLKETHNAARLHSTDHLRNDKTDCVHGEGDKNTENKAAVPPSMHAVRSMISTAVTDIYNIISPISLTFSKEEVHPAIKKQILISITSPSPYSLISSAHWYRQIFSYQSALASSV